MGVDKVNINQHGERDQEDELLPRLPRSFLFLSWTKDDRFIK